MQLKNFRIGSSRTLVAEASTPLEFWHNQDDGGGPGTPERKLILGPPFHSPELVKIPEP